MGYSARAVANYFIDKAKREGDPVDHLKLQKLIYLAHGWHIALHPNGDPLVDNENPEAWKYGPVFASVYHDLKENGAKPIRDLIEQVDVDANAHTLRIHTPSIKASDHDVCRLLDKVLEKFGNFTGLELSDMTHRRGSPWDNARSRSTRINEHITVEDLRDHFTQRMNK